VKVGVHTSHGLKEPNRTLGEEMIGLGGIFSLQRKGLPAEL
jgi:hypothetical protein